MPKKDNFIDEEGKVRPAGDYDDNYAAGAVEGGYTERRQRRKGAPGGDADAPFDPISDREAVDNAAVEGRPDETPGQAPPEPIGQAPPQAAPRRAGTRRPPRSLPTRGE